MKWIVKCFRNYAVFNGRAGREEYTYFTLFVVFIQFFFLSVDFLIGWEFENINEVIPVLPLFEISRLITILPALSVTVRRLHDINNSGWWVLLVLTIIGFIPLAYYCFFEKSDKGENQYGLSPT